MLDDITCIRHAPVIAPRVKCTHNNGQVRRVGLFGIQFTPLALEETLDRVVARPAGARLAFVVTPNAQHVMAINRSPDRLASLYNEQAWLCVCDSQVVRLLAGIAGTPLPLCAGSDLTQALFTRRLEPGDRVTVIGCDVPVVARLRKMFGGVRFHHHNPPMGFFEREEEMMDCVSFVEEHPSRYVILAVGSPQQENLASRIAQRGRAVGTALCVGGSLHFVTGTKPRAPLWMRRMGLEWAFRVAREPRRLMSRLVINSFPILIVAAPVIIAQLGRELAGLTRKSWSLWKPLQRLVAAEQKRS